MKRTAFPLSYFLFLISYSLFTSCKTTGQISKQATKTLITDTAISKGFIGISVFDPSANKYLYNYNADKYFVPASNTKLFTLYAGMKYLGDSLVGIEYQLFSDTAINVITTGDPTFLHPDFKNQPVLDFLRGQNKKIYISGNYRDNELGYGWAWDDYNETFMAERNAMPIYGNMIKIGIDGYTSENKRFVEPKWKVEPVYFGNFLDSFFVTPLKEVAAVKDTIELKKRSKSFIIKRNKNSNKLSTVYPDDTAEFVKQEVPFFTNKIKTTIDILKTDFKLNIKEGALFDNSLYPQIPAHLQTKKIYSQASDSLYKIMMHRSDNFFAEQSLIMIANKMQFPSYNNSTSDLTNKILSDDLSDAPQKPKWVDGSGLSRYNLFTPQDFVYILNKMKNEFGIERMKTILATGGEGTIKNYFKKDAGFIYAKTGTLSNNCALSGYVITKKNRLLIFSVLANNYQTGATPVRRAVEKFVEYLRDGY